jgi:tetratricopeptide (TPR) repeat protein
MPFPDAPESPPAAARPGGRTAALFVAAFAFLVASFPARNADVWGHLAAGRDLVGADAGTTWAADPNAGPGWLYNLGAYLVYSVAGGTGLVLVKAAMVAATAVVLLRLSRSGPGWVVPVFCTGLAVLAMGTRLLLQPATVSLLFLALTLWLLWRKDDPADRPPVVPWVLAGLFLVWANTDRWFVVGLGLVALTWLGQTLDRPGPGRLAAAGRRAGGLAVLAAACLVNPAHVFAFRLAFTPPPGSAARPVTSPFDPAYLAGVTESPAAMAYFPLLGLGLLSFLLALPRWRWGRVLPWAGLAALSVVQVRTVPYFAAVAGPVLAWNLTDFFARRANAAARPAAGWRRLAGRALTGLAGLAFLACAWPGWLQGPPFEPRRWAIDTAPALRRGAEAACAWHSDGRLGADAHALYLAPEAAAAFAWFCPAARGAYDPDLATAVVTDSGDWPARLRAAGVTHLVVYDPDRERLMAVLGGLLADPAQWPLLWSEGDLAVFGWRDPDRPAGPDRFRDSGPDFDRLALRPELGDRAPRSGPAADARPRRWWEAFWKSAPPAPLDRNAAELYLLNAEALRRTYAYRKLAAWEATQVAGLVASAAAADGPRGVLDVYTRLVYFRPPVPGALPDPIGGPAVTQMRAFFHGRDDTPPGLLYLAVRAARRALAVNPEDARAHLALGEAYLRLIQNTRERAWARHLPELGQLRRVQAAAALSRAVRLDPGLARAHLNLGALFLEREYLDLALHHQRAYVRAFQEAGPPRGVSPDQFREQEAAARAALAELADAVGERERALARESSGLRVIDRAAMAREKGLVGKALDILLNSDIAAFGAAGMAMELDLLLRTGRVREVIEWTESGEHQGALGPTFHWMRAQALAAAGEYARAHEEYRRLAGEATQADGGPRPVMAALVAQAVLDGQPGVGGLGWLFGRALPRADFEPQVTSLAGQLRRAADATTLRGLLALEAGEVEEAELAFRQALDTWESADAAAAGRGLDFTARPVAEACLRWLEAAGK